MSEIRRLSPDEAEVLSSAAPAWRMADASLVRTFRFADFRQAMDFVNDVALLADERDHHPDISISYGTVVLTLSTHKVGGLSQRDFELASAIDELPGAKAQH